jgi:hypothetical protein
MWNNLLKENHHIIINKKIQDVKRKEVKKVKLSL